MLKISKANVTHKYMIKKNIELLLFIGLFLFIGVAYADKKQDRKFESPDGKFIAYIIALPNAPYGSGESKIIIKTKQDKVLYSKDYSSEDGEHGFGVERAAWTPNSKFFVYSMSSSGGHQAWHFPTDFIDVSDFKIRSLDKYLGPITDPDFELIAPDIIRITGQSIADLEKEVNSKKSLEELIRKNN
jgi:hypothetical protein